MALRSSVVQTLTASVKPIGHGVSPQIYDDDGSGSRYGAPALTPVPIEHYIEAVVFLCVTTGFVYYWISIPLILTKFDYGYTNFNSDIFMSARYGFHWWIVWGLNLNVIPVLLLAFALLNNLTPRYAGLHALFAYHLTWINIALLALQTIQWVFVCNNFASGGATSCNAYTWCCVYWPSAWCVNNAACDPPVLSVGFFDRNREALQNWAFCFAFSILAWFHSMMNAYLIRVGVLQ